jgi:hypothetical protein
MNPWVLLFLWIIAQSLQVVFALSAIGTRDHAKVENRLGSLTVSGFAAVLPLLTFVLFLGVFVIGRSSNVAQLAGEDGYELWKLWFHAWPLLFFGNPVSLLVLLVAVFLPPYPPRNWASTLSRICGAFAAAFALYITFTYFPDA